MVATIPTITVLRGAGVAATISTAEISTITTSHTGREDKGITQLNNMPRLTAEVVVNLILPTCKVSTGVVTDTIEIASRHQAQQKWEVVRSNFIK